MSASHLNTLLPTALTRLCSPTYVLTSLEAECLKYQRDGKTDKDSIINFYGEDICQRMNDIDNAFTPTPFLLSGGMPGRFVSWFFYGTTPIPLHAANFDDRPQAAEAARRVISHHMPSGIWLRANEAWRQSQLTATITHRTQLTPMN